MKPGCELDALVAEKVMGWTSSVVPFGEHKMPLIGNPKLQDNEHYLLAANVSPYPPYSTDISAAWEVVEILRVKERALILEYLIGVKKWEVAFVDYPSIKKWAVRDEEAPLAICLAALKAVGVEP